MNNPMETPSTEAPSFVPDNTGKDEIKSPEEVLENLVDSEDKDQGRLVEIRNTMLKVSSESTPAKIGTTMDSVQRALKDVEATLNGFEFAEKDDRRDKLEAHKAELEKQKLTLENLMQNK